MGDCVSVRPPPPALLVAPAGQPWAASPPGRPPRCARPGKACRGHGPGPAGPARQRRVDRFRGGWRGEGAGARGGGRGGTRKSEGEGAHLTPIRTPASEDFIFDAFLCSGRDSFPSAPCARGQRARGSGSSVGTREAARVVALQRDGAAGVRRAIPRVGAKSARGKRLDEYGSRR